MNSWLATVLIGIGATAFADLWSLLRRRLFGVPLPNFGLVGRWIGGMPRGRFRHPSIAAAPAIRGELAIGWGAHYLIGRAFACLMPLLWGQGWLRQPSLGPALAVGAVTVLAPYLLLQPGMGAGIAASKTPRPWTARMHSLVMHLIFGLGLYLAALVVNRLLAG